MPRPLPSADDVVRALEAESERGALTVRDLAETIHSHPTLPEALMEAAEAVHQRAIHFMAPRR